MIRVQTKPAKSPALTRVPPFQVMVGPSRHRNPARALRRDMDEIAAAEGGVDETALLQRGWTLAEIAQHLPAARNLGGRAPA